jgi:hypothetical protein
MTNWLDQVYRAHSDLLARVEAGGESSALIDEARALIEQARQAGVYVHSASDRDYMHSLLSFWGGWLFKQTRTYPNTDLYPAAPPAAPAASAPLPLPPNNFALPGSPPARPRASGQPFILASIAAPPDGTTAAIGEQIGLVGIYANLRPLWQLRFVAQDEIGRLILLDAGFSPTERPDAGTWSASFTPAAAGAYHLGVLLAITAEAVDVCRAAFEASRPLDATPDGAVTFADLVVLTVR